MKLDYIALFLVLFFLAACGSKSSSPDMVDDNALPAEETFKDIDLANNLKDCGIYCPVRLRHASHASVSEIRWQSTQADLYTCVVH